MVHSRFVFLVALLFAAASPVVSATTIDLGREDFRRWGSGTGHHSLEGLRVSTGTAVRMPRPVPDFNVTRNSIVPYQGISNALKKAARATPAQVAASAAFATVFAAVDYVLDQGEFVKVEYEEAPLSPGHFQWGITRNGYGTRYAPSPVTACNNMAQFFTSGGRTWEIQSVQKVDDGRYNCIFRYRDQPWYSWNSNNTQPAVRVGSGCPDGTMYDPGLAACSSSFPVPLSDADFDALTPYWPDQSPSQLLPGVVLLNDLGFNSDLGASDGVITGPASVDGPATTTTTTLPTGESQTTVTTPTHHMDYSPTTVTNTGTTEVTNTYINGNLTNTTTTNITNPSTPPVAQAPELPTDCEFMPTVCAWLEWFKTPFDAPDVDMPVITDEDYSQEYAYSISASCPADYVINISIFPPVPFSWQPFCDLAVMIKPLVIGSAALFSAFITLGIGRARD